MFWNLLTFGAASWLVGKHYERKAQQDMERHEAEMDEEWEEACWEAELAEEVDEELDEELDEEFDKELDEEDFDDQ